MKLAGSNEYISGGLIEGSKYYKKRVMKILRIYSLENDALTETQCVQIKDTLKLDLVVQLKAETKLENRQYPVFEFETIYEEPDLMYNAQSNTLNLIREQAIKMSDRKQ